MLTVWASRYRKRIIFWRFSLEIQVEVTDEMFSDSIGGLDMIKKEIGEKIKSVVGIKAAITLVAPHTIPRSEGKAKRIIDKRKL